MSVLSEEKVRELIVESKTLSLAVFCREVEQAVLEACGSGDAVAVMGNNGMTKAKSEFRDVDEFLRACRNNTPLYTALQVSAVPEHNNIRSIERISDQSLRIMFSSCRAASAFESWLSAAPQPAKAASDDKKLIELLRAVWKDGFDSENYDDIDWCNEITIAQSEEGQNPRITEQDVREIIKSFMQVYIPFNVTSESWFSAEGRALLDKLNEVK